MQNSQCLPIEMWAIFDRKKTQDCTNFPTQIFIANRYRKFLCTKSSALLIVICFVMLLECADGCDAEN